MRYSRPIFREGGTAIYDVQNAVQSDGLFLETLIEYVERGTGGLH